MGMLYLCSRKIEHAPACNRRSLSFKCEVLYTLLLVDEKEATSTSRSPPSKSQSGWDSWRKDRGRIKRQKTHIRSLTDLHTPKRARLVLVTKFVEFTLICDNSWKKLSTALRYTQNSGQKKLIVSRQPIFINLNNLIPWKTRCKDTISYSNLQEFYLFSIEISH